MKTIILGAITLVMVFTACGPSEEEKRAEVAKQKAIQEDSIKKENEAFGKYYNETKEKFKGELVKEADFFMDYTTGSIEVPAGCIWKLGKYNIQARKWDTVKVDDETRVDPCDRKRLSGDGKMLNVTKVNGVLVTTIIINGVILNIPAGRCADDNTRGVNSMIDVNDNPNRLIIENVYLPPGTKICIPSNRLNTLYGTYGLLTIEQYKLKEPKFMDDFAAMVMANKKRESKWGAGNYPTWELSDKANNDKLDIIGELSNNLDWYKP